MNAEQLTYDWIVFKMNSDSKTDKLIERYKLRLNFYNHFVKNKNLVINYSTEKYFRIVLVSEILEELKSYSSIVKKLNDITNVIIECRKKNQTYTYMEDKFRNKLKNFLNYISSNQNELGLSELQKLNEVLTKMNV